jgi:sulfoxide reductase heme-binding subunit YedZ
MAMVLAAATQTASPLLWYVTRATAVAAYITLAVGAIVGMLRPIARASNERMSWLVDIAHTALTVLATVLTLGHLVSLVFDTFVPFTILNLLIPTSETYRPLGTALGVLGMYAMAAVLLTSWAKPRLSYGFWRVTHYLSFVAFILVTLHGLLAGSDSREPFMRAIYGACAGAVAFMGVMRILVRPRAAGAPANAGAVTPGAQPRRV